MKILSFLLMFSCNLLFSQTEDCFSEANYQREQDLKSAPKLKIGDDGSSVIKSVENAQKKVVGCKFPYAPFRTTDSKELEFSKIKADFIYINFNYLFSDYCLGQLDSLVAFKKRSKDKISIVSFFSHPTKDIQFQIDKYHDDVIFVSDADSYTQKYDLKSGRPANYVLDKNKIIIYAGAVVPNETEIASLVKKRGN